MKIFLFLILFTGHSWAKSLECSNSQITLYGDIVFIKYDKESGKRITDIQFNTFPKNWNVNSDQFYSLYLENLSKENISHVEIDLKSFKNKNFKWNKKLKLIAKKNKTNFLVIDEIQFNKDILPNFTVLPVEMKLKVYSNKKEVCTEIYKLEVIR